MKGSNPPPRWPRPAPPANPPTAPSSSTLDVLVQEMRQLTAAINRMAETNEKVVQALMQVVAEGEGEEEDDQPQPQRYLDGTLIS